MPTITFCLSIDQSFTSLNRSSISLLMSRRTIPRLHRRQAFWGGGYGFGGFPYDFSYGVTPYLDEEDEEEDRPSSSSQSKQPSIPAPNRQSKRQAKEALKAELWRYVRSLPIPNHLKDDLYHRIWKGRKALDDFTDQHEVLKDGYQLPCGCPLTAIPPYLCEYGFPYWGPSEFCGCEGGWGGNGNDRSQYEVPEYGSWQNYGYRGQ
jgi:hypothetical protein